MTFRSAAWSAHSPEIPESNGSGELIFSAALKAARMCAWEWDLCSGDVKLSDNAPDVIGQPVVFPLKSGWAEVHPEDAVELRQAIDSAIAQGDSWSAQFRWIRPDTRTFRWMEVQGCVLRNAHGDSVKATGILLDITDRKTGEEELRTSQRQLARELEATQRLQEISTRLIAEDKAELLYEHLLDAAIAIMRSDFASMQMLYPERGESGELLLLAFRGFTPEAAAFWQRVSFDSKSTSCGIAVRNAVRVIVPDVETVEAMAGTADLDIYRQTSIRAMQSTPLVSRSGKVVGMISTHWNRPHEPSERDLRLFDILARQTADLIERKRAEDDLRESQTWLAGQRAALEATLNGAPLETALGILASTVPAVMGERVRAAFYLANSEGTMLHHLVGMGAEYGQAVDGFKIGPESLACGLATHTGEPVLTTDITKDPLWQPWIWLAEKFG